MPCSRSSAAGSSYQPALPPEESWRNQRPLAAGSPAVLEHGAGEVLEAGGVAARVGQEDATQATRGAGREGLLRRLAGEGPPVGERRPFELDAAVEDGMGEVYRRVLDADAHRVAEPSRECVPAGTTGVGNLVVRHRPRLRGDSGDSRPGIAAPAARDLQGAREHARGNEAERRRVPAAGRPASSRSGGARRGRPGFSPGRSTRGDRTPAFPRPRTFAGAVHPAHRHFLWHRQLAYIDGRPEQPPGRRAISSDSRSIADRWEGPRSHRGPRLPAPGGR